MKKQVNVRLKEALAEKGRSQGWLAKVVGMERVYVSKVANGHTIPNIYNALRISRAIGVPIERIWVFE